MFAFDVVAPSPAATTWLAAVCDDGSIGRATAVAPANIDASAPLTTAARTPLLALSIC
ncbi:MAG: hypothetical protein JO367_00950 [Actinobacteria bacterium]|nr:hypothetical protein [Actinomycetota bacterium]